MSLNESGDRRYFGNFLKTVELSPSRWNVAVGTPTGILPPTAYGLWQVGDVVEFDESYRDDRMNAPKCARITGFEINAGALENVRMECVECSAHSKKPGDPFSEAPEMARAFYRTREVAFPA